MTEAARKFLLRWSFTKYTTPTLEKLRAGLVRAELDARGG